MDGSATPVTPSNQTHEVIALKRVSCHLWFWVTNGLFIWLDLWSKDRVFTTLDSNEVITAIPGTVVFRRSLNDGAVFGSFTGYVAIFIVASILAAGFVLYMFGTSRSTQRFLHVGLALILAGAMGNLYDRAFSIADIVVHHQRSGKPEVIIGRIISDPSDSFVRVGDWPDGAHPRTFHRDEVEIRRQGVVRDFIKFVPRFPSWFPVLGGRDVWPWIFNVADAALVCGFGLVMLSGRCDPRPGRTPQPEQT